LKLDALGKAPEQSLQNLFFVGAKIRAKNPFVFIVAGNPKPNTVNFFTID
jgi:hypothetical protein